MSNPAGAFWNISGVATRSEFWMWTFFLLGTSIVIRVLAPYLAGIAAISPVLINLPWYGICLLLFTPLVIRRLHDVNMSGWWVLWYLYLPCVLFVAAVFIYFATRAVLPSDYDSIGMYFIPGICGLISAAILLVAVLTLLRPGAQRGKYAGRAGLEKAEKVF